jgi:4-hydroxy-tetrahydrodipicolinate synthase
MPTIARFVPRFSGYMPALPTPFDAENRIDTVAFARLCELQIAAGATALVVCGTTGEAPTLTPGEQWQLVRCAVEAARGRVPVIAGAGSNSTAHAIELTQGAEAAGADAILSVVPYYNKPGQAGLYAHFAAVAAATELPVILYDVPSRTACGLADETVARLAELPNVCALKDATGDVTRPARLRPLLESHFRLLSGDDATAMAFLLNGGHGCISVTSNVAPGLCRSLFLACRQEQIGRAQRLANALGPLTAALFKETNPAPLKHALSLFGLMSPRVRLPLVELPLHCQAELAAALAEVGARYEDHMIGALSGGAMSARVAM